MCSDFDKIAGTPGVAQRDYVAATDMTLLSYALSTAGKPHQSMPLAMYSRGTSSDKKTQARLELAKRYGIGMFVYNAGHVWYVKRLGDHEWKQIDSLSGIRNVSLESLWRDGLGVEIIFPIDGDPSPGYAPEPIAAPAAILSPTIRAVRRALPPPPPVQSYERRLKSSRMSLGFMS